MASQDEDNKLECISNVNKEQERYFLNVYKKHECILNNKNESFENKVESLIEVWRSVGELNLSQFDIRHVIQIMDWAKLHALNIVLTAEWNSFKATHQSKLLQEIEKAQNELLKLNSGFATRCKKLADVVKNPWEDVVLMKLMKTKNAEIGPEEIEFFCVETAYVVSVRLKKLCESHCEDLALNLVTAFMNCNKLSKTQNFSLNATETQMWFIFDIYIALLYKFQEKQKMVLLLKELTFEEGLQLVKRFAKKRVKISKIWKSCQRIAVLATQMYISQAVVKYTDDLKGILESYIEMYVSLCNTDSLLQDFSTSIRRISNLADAAGLYIFCAVIQKTAGAKLKTFVIEMYIRALTTDMNELERQKDANEKEKVAATTSRLAAAFCNLADFLDEHVKVARECVLTAFSLEPTKERLKTIETLARRSGFQVLDTGQEWKCRLHPPVLPSDDIAWMCPECGDWMCKPQLNIPLKINMALNEALQNSVLGISEALCDDLVVCLSNPRYQILSWFLPWDDLHRLCIMYLQDPETTKNFVTELKFVDIDYSIFKGIKREPLDELAGIERGYEQYLDQDFVSDEETSSVSEDSMSQDSRPYSLGSDGAGEGPYLPMLPPQPKSDPNTLKSLRMFRPSLKRPKANGSTDDLPQKLHKVDSAVNSNHPHTVTSNFKGPPKNENSASLSSFLNGISSTSPQLSAVNSQDSHSKNVKAATLPPLGGQVANLIKPIQVKLQPLTKLCQVKEKSPRTPKHTAGQALKPYNQTKGTISESTRKDLVLKILSKSSLNGAKENSNSSKTGQNSELSTVRPLEMPSPPTTEKATQNPEVPSEVSTPQTLIPSTTRQQVQQHLEMQTHQPTKAHLLAVKGNSHSKRSTSCLPACTKSQLQSPKTQMPPLQNIPTSQVSQPQEINHIGTQTRQNPQNPEVPSEVSTPQTLIPSTTRQQVQQHLGMQTHQPTKAHSLAVKGNSHPKRSTSCLPATTKSQLQSPKTQMPPLQNIPASQVSQPQEINHIGTQTRQPTIAHSSVVKENSHPKRSKSCLPASTKSQLQSPKTQMPPLQNIPTSQVSQPQEINHIGTQTRQNPQNPEVPSEVSTPQTLIPSITRQQVQQHIGMQTHQPTKAHSLAVKGNSHPKRSTSCLPASTKSQLQSPKTQMPPLQNIPASQVSQPQEINHIGTQTRQPAIAHSSVVKENSHPKRLTNCLPASTKSQIPNTETTQTSHSCHLQKLNPQKTAPVTKNAQIEETVATRIPQVNQIKNSQNSANCLPVSKNTRVQDMNDIKIAHLNQSEKSNVKQSQKCQKPNQLDALELELLTTSLTPHLGRWELPNMDLPPNYVPQPSAQLNPHAQPNKSRLNPSGPLSNLPPPAHPKTGNQPVLGKLSTPQGKCSVPLKSDKVQKLMSPQDKASPSSPLMKHQELTPLSPDRTLIVPLNPSLVDTLVSSYTKNNSEPSKDRQPQVQEASSRMDKIESRQKTEAQISSIKATQICKNEANLKSNKGCNLDSIDKKCNTGQMGSSVQGEVTKGSDVDSRRKFVMNEKSESSEVAQQQKAPKNCLGVIDDGIFSDPTDCEHKSEDLLFKNNNDYSSIVIKDDNAFENSPNEEIPKNFNLTENIRTYTKKCTKRIPVEKDCVKKLTGDAKFDVCKNVYSSTSVNKPHSNVQKPQTNKELIVVLHRLPSNKLKARHSASDIDRNSSIKRKCDRGKTPPKNVRKRKSMDKSENLTEKAPNRVQNHKLSPLQDINPRVTPKENSKLCCDDLNKLKDTFQDSLTPRVLLERIHIDNKSYARSVLANVPGLNDYQMIRPANVNHIVNVVQVSGGRTTQNVPLQNTQTSTQVSPHIQRIGQPRVTDQKPEHSSSLISTTTLTTTTTTAKTTTSQPSTLINILSQQIIRPVTSPTNALRRQTPFINILSQQIIRPSQTQKTPNANTLTTDNNQAKPPGSTEQAVNTQANNVAKSTLASIKTNTTTTGQGGTILQFICKSSLPKFQQAFGKSVYQNNTEASNTTASTIETTNIAVDAKKNITKTVPVNVQPIQGSVIYSRQMPVGQTISLIPPGGTTRQVFRIATSNSDQISLVKDGHIHSKMSALLAALQGRPKNSEGDQVNSEEKVTLARPTLVQNARIVKPVQLQIPPSVVRTTPQANLSSTTLEQLREFDMVYKQIKERSSSTTPAETSNSPPENQEVTQQRISVTYVNQLQKYTQLSPVVVVSSYSNLQPAASPALSVTSQGSSSPCVTPAPTPTLPKIATKSSKGKTLKNTPNNSTTKSSPVPKPQQKPQEDEHTTQRIFDILAEYAEQLRNSPDLNNKPAPRRRSNPPTNPSQNSKRKKSSSGSKKSGQSSNAIEIDADDITVGSEDSSGGGIVQLSVTDDEQSQAATVNTPESTENSSPSSSRQLILTESPTCGNQSRNLIIADSSVGEALKIPNTAVIVPGSYIMPVSMVKGGQQIAVVSGGSKILATVPARSGQNMLLFQSFMNQNRKGAISAVKYSAIQPISGISSQSLAGVSAQPPVILPSNSVATAVTLGQPLTLKKLNDDRDSNELLLTISQPKEDNKNTEMPQPDSSTSISSDSNDIKMEEGSIQSDNSNEKIFQTFQKSVITNSVATSVIATTSSSCIKDDEENPNQDIITMNLTTDNKVEPKSSERMQSVLVTACSSNGPMLSHTTPRYRKPSDTGRTNNNDLPKEEFLHNGEKTNNTEQKSFRGNVTYYTNKTKKNCADTQKMDSEMQKQAAIERELRLQKSLSEECEDLGVDEPSTSDLFPEADLLFDSNHSPSFDQSSQDIIKRAPQSSEIKEEVKGAMNLFSDDENSSSLRTDLFEYVEYQTVETALDYQARQLMNGNTTSNESGSSGCEDNTLLAKCATMSEVTLNSPISPEMYSESSLNKYKFKYSNRKKGDRMKQGDFGGEIVSSSEDTIGSTELGKINCEDDNFKVVHVAITKTDIVKEDEKCELHCEEDLDSPSGRGARRSVRKLCSCCNGSQDGNISRKRPHTSRPHTPAAPHKKAFLNKKR